MVNFLKKLFRKPLGASTIFVDLTFSTTNRAYFRDTGMFIYSPSSGVLTIEASTTLNLGKTGADATFGYGTLSTFKPQTNEKGSLGTSSLRWFNLFLGGDIDIESGNIITDTSTGMKIATSSSQKLGFFGASPITQPTATTDLATVLSNLGLRAAGTAFSLTTTGAVSTGALTCVNSAKVGGTLNVNTTSVGNIGTGEDDLRTYSVSGNTLTATGMRIKFSASGTTANNANAKRIRIKWGATTILDTGASGIPTSVAGQWRAEGEIIRTGATTQKCNARFTVNSTTFAGYTTAAETLSGSVTFKFTGEATADNDIVQETMSIEFGSA